MTARSCEGNDIYRLSHTSKRTVLVNYITLFKMNRGRFNREDTQLCGLRVLESPRFAFSTAESKHSK